jgi:hypothetical protein
VKAIGTGYDDFELILQSIPQGVSVGSSISPYEAINQLLLRVYQAAKQLAKFGGRRIAVVVIGEINWIHFDFQLHGGWVDWSNPSFLSAEQRWETTLRRLERDDPGIRTNLASAVKAIDAVWIMKRLENYEYRLEYEIPTRSAAPADT